MILLKTFIVWENSSKNIFKLRFFYIIVISKLICYQIIHISICACSHNIIKHILFICWKTFIPIRFSIRFINTKYIKT